MNIITGILALIGICYAVSYLFGIFGKIACWAIGGVATFVGTVLVGGFVLVGAYLAALAFYCASSLCG